MTKLIEIEGIAIVEGISRNKIKYISEELKKFAPTMVGRPILKDHENKTDNVIGKVTNSEALDNGKRVRYKGWVKEDGTGIIDKIHDKRISEVSIGAMAGRMVKESEDVDYTIAKDLNCLELSTTPCPGVLGTSLFPSENTIEYTEETIKKIIEENKEEIKEQLVRCSTCNKMVNAKKEGDIFICPNCKKKIEIPGEETQEESCSSSKEDINNNVKGGKMESTQTEVNTKVDESAALKTKLDELTKLNEALNEKIRQDAIKSYSEKAKVKGVKEMDVSKMSIDVITALSAQLDAVEVKKVEEKKEVAQPKTEEVKTEAKPSVDFSGYIVESSEQGGYAFYKSD
jgi:hypothetical protein